MSEEAAFWPPDARLGGYVTGYHRYRIGGAPGRRIADVFYPAWINLRFTLAAEGGWSVRIGRFAPVAVPEAAAFGPTSHAGYVDVSRGEMVGIGLSPLGWARLFDGDAKAIADRVVPLSTVTDCADAILASLRAGADPVALFDTWLLSRLAASAAEPPALGAIFAALADPAIDDVTSLAARVALPPRRLLELTRHAFGFTPKLLLRRARFLRALMAASQTDRGGWSDAVRDAGYYDQSHFHRDCQLFLGTSLSAFMGMERPLNRASMIARAATLGQPMQSLAPPVIAVSPDQGSSP